MRASGSRSRGCPQEVGAQAVRILIRSTLAKSWSAFSPGLIFGSSRRNRVAQEALSTWIVSRLLSMLATRQCGAMLGLSRARSCSVQDSRLDAPERAVQGRFWAGAPPRGSRRPNGVVAACWQPCVEPVDCQWVRAYACIVAHTWSPRAGRVAVRALGSGTMLRRFNAPGLWSQPPLTRVKGSFRRMIASVLRQSRRYP